jgi:hypothetical protein
MEGNVMRDMRWGRDKSGKGKRVLMDYQQRQINDMLSLTPAMTKQHNMVERWWNRTQLL